MAEEKKETSAAVRFGKDFVAGTGSPPHRVYPILSSNHYGTSNLNSFHLDILTFTTIRREKIPNFTSDFFQKRLFRRVLGSNAL